MSMTREKAIAVLMNNNEYHHAKGELSHSALSVEAFNMAIEALKEMSVEEYRQSLMDVFHRTDHDELLTYVVMPKEEEFKSLEYILRKQPFEPRPHGEWIKKYDEKTQYYTCTCSICGDTHRLLINYFLESNFCPHCGADMRPKEGDENG